MHEFGNGLCKGLVRLLLLFWILLNLILRTNIAEPFFKICVPSNEII